MIEPEELMSLWLRIEGAGVALANYRDPLRQAFGEHLQLVATACYQLAKTLDGDNAPGSEHDAIRATLGGTGPTLLAMIGQAKVAQEQLRRALRDAIDESEAMTPAQLEAENERHLEQLRKLLDERSGQAK